METKKTAEERTLKESLSVRVEHIVRDWETACKKSGEVSPLCSYTAHHLLVCNALDVGHLRGLREAEKLVAQYGHSYLLERVRSRIADLEGK